MKQTFERAAATVTSLCLAAPAFAAGPAFSGLTANADSAETVVTNPAGMMRLEGPAFYGNPMLVYTDSETELESQALGGSQDISDDGFLAMPGIYYARPLGERWAIGIGPNAATGLGTTYDDDWAGRYLVEEWSLAFVGIAPAVAYRVSDKLSLGASLSIMYSQYNLEKAVFNLDPAASDGSFEITADGWGVGASFGLLYEATPHTRFGLVYRSEVSVTDEGDPEFSDLTPQRRQLLDAAGVLDEDISFDTGVPQMVTAGMFHDFQNDWSFSLDLMWVDFSEFGVDNLQIGNNSITKADTSYDDIWGVTLGVNYRFSRQWTARGGAFYVSSALEDSDRTAFMRLDEMWGVGLGAEYAYRNGRSVALDLTFIQFGDGEFSARNVPLAGDVEGKYTTSYAVVIGLGTRW